MVRRAWVSWGAVLLLGVAGCASEEATPGPEAEGPTGEPSPAVEPPPVEPDGTPDEEPDEAPDKEPPPVSQEDLCPTPDLGRMPAEAIGVARPDRSMCELSPDGCDALRPLHARRHIPRPCRAWDTSSSGELMMAYRLGHDAEGRLTSMLMPWGGDAFFTYDACHRTKTYSHAPGRSSRHYYEAWRWDPAGNFLQRDFETNAFSSSLTLGRETSQSVAWMTPIHQGQYQTQGRHQYTLDAQGRITHATGTSFDLDGEWVGAYAWEEERRYDADGALTEVRRSREGKLLWLKELSQGRVVRQVSSGGQFETRWTYGAAGEVLRIETEEREETTLAPKHRLAVEYQYGADGRLLRFVSKGGSWWGAGWSERESVFVYHYAEDGRLLRREYQPVGPGYPSIYQYDYTCTPGPVDP